MVGLLGKYSQFASASDKTAVRQTLGLPAAAEAAAAEAAGGDDAAPPGN